MIRFGTATCLVTGLLAAAGASAQQAPAGWTAEPPVSPALSRDADIYGWQLMTHQERNAYRERMRTAASEDERGQFRAEHQAAMQVRAQARGVVLPAPVHDISLWSERETTISNIASRYISIFLSAGLLLINLGGIGIYIARQWNRSGHARSSHRSVD